MKIDSSSLSKYRQEIYGISAIGIILLHINKYVSLLPMTSLSGKIISIIFENGNVGVDIFLILSAIGLSRSIKFNSITTFYMHRYQRVYLPYFLIAIIYFSWYDIFVAEDGIINFLLNITAINYWIIGDRFPLWFISFILFIYIVFPLLYRYSEKNKKIIAILIILFVGIEVILWKTSSPMYLNYEIVLSRIPIFLLGLSLSKQEFSINEKYIIFLILGGGISFILTYIIRLPQYTQRYLLTWFGIAIVLIYIIVREEGYFSLLSYVHN